jgi:hypothetical protein
MESPAALKSSTQLLVEGINPKRIFSVLCKSWGLSDIDIHDFGNNENLRPYLETFTKTQGFRSVKRLGIIRDAETSADSALQSVRDSLRNAGLEYPSLRVETTSGSPSISVFLLPDTTSEGNLESLLWRTIKDTSEARCADEFLKCLDLGSIAITRRDKARVQAYLASKHRPHGSVGVAAQRGQWDPKHDAFSEIRRFLTDLQGGTSASDTTENGPENESGVSGKPR